MKKLITRLVATLALASSPSPRTSPRQGAATPGAAAIVSGYGYRGWRGYGWGWGGWWGPSVAISIGGYGRRCWSPTYGYYPCRYRWGY